MRQVAGDFGDLLVVLVQVCKTVELLIVSEETAESHALCGRALTCFVFHLHLEHEIMTPLLFFLLLFLFRDEFPADLRLVLMILPKLF